MLDLVKNNPAVIAEAGYEFNVVLPDGTVTDAKIKVRGSNSPAVKDYGRRMFKEVQMRENAARKRGKQTEDLYTLEEAEEKAAEGAAVRVITWSKIAEDGKEIPFTKEEAIRIFREYPFIREQVLEASNDIMNFRHE